MRLFIFYFILFFSCILKTVAQNTLPFKPLFMIGGSGGVSFPLTKFRIGQETDYLCGYKDLFIYGRPIEISHVLFKNYGIAASIEYDHVDGNSLRTDNFKNKIQQQYQDNFYILEMDSKGESEGTEVMKGQLGIFYTMDKPNFFIRPQISIGVLSLDAKRYDIFLKEKNTNQVFSLRYDYLNSRIDYFTTDLSVRFGYKLSHRFAICLDASLSHFKMNLTFQKDYQNLYTQELTSEQFNYYKNILAASTGIGFTYLVSKRTTKQKTTIN